MKKLLLLLCFIAGINYHPVAQSLTINRATSKLFPAVCDSGTSQDLTYKIVYQGPKNYGIESLGLKYKVNEDTFSNTSLFTVDTLISGDTITVGDTVVTSYYNGFNYDTDDIIVIWPTGTGSITIKGDSILDTTYVSIKSGISSPNNSFNISLSPNPAANLLYLNYDENSVHLKQVKIYDLFGQTMITKTSLFGFIDINELPAGLYFFEAESTDGSKYITQFIRAQ